MDKVEFEIKNTGRQCEIKLNGEKLDAVTEASVYVGSGEYLKVIIKKDADVEIKGYLIKEFPITLKCKNCHHIIGDVIGNYDVRCPLCNSDIVKE